MRQTHRMLAQEPWCFDPERIATLTDWQIANLYVQPAIERAKRRQSESLPDHVVRDDMPADHRPGDPPSPDAPEFKEWVIAQFMAMGMTRRTAEEKYEEQAN